MRAQRHRQDVAECAREAAHQARAHASTVVRNPRLDHRDRLVSDGPCPQPLDLGALQLVLPLPDGRKQPANGPP
ncbi:hypothetical protein ACFVHI_10555 [Kitasatospora sp. NPDC127121]|uniref:hypothetical protein n=1 Tax=Kitasatospora sp. NPDC127121 TaxID=3345371 RepID=UPI00363A187C